MKRIMFFLLLLAHILGFSQKIINVDFADSTGVVKDLLGGNLYFENTADFLHNEGIKIIRTHDIHHALDYSDYSAFWNFDGAGTYTINQNFDPYDTADYSWRKADSVINIIVNNNFDIFFRIGVSYPNPNIFPLPPYDPPVNSTSEPFNFSRFASLTKHIIMHYNEGWNNGHFYNVKYWELWNEPGGLFWHGTPLQFYRMYEAVSDTLKNYSPDIKLGAPGAVPSTTIGVNTKYREDFIAYCSQNNLPLDFYSWHIYGYKNPYGIKYFADTIRNILDANGYTETESYITEINNVLNGSLDTFAISPFGAAYYLSTILTAQIAPVDKLFWYPSCVGVIQGITGDTISSRTYYGMTCFHTLQNETPVEVYNDGNETVEGSWDTLQRNFMVLSSRSEDDEKFSILISNFSSDISDIVLNLTNLPWDNSDSILITKKIIDKNNIFKTEQQILKGNNNITLTDNNRNASYILFYQLQKIVPTGNGNAKTGEFKVVSPVRNFLYLKNIPDEVKYIDIYSVSGKKMLSITVSSKINVSDFSQGVYLISLKDKQRKVVLTKKFIVP